MLAAVKTASRRFKRWPSASLDRSCARRVVIRRPGRRNGAPPNRETSRIRSGLVTGSVGLHPGVELLRCNRRIEVRIKHGLPLQENARQGKESICDTADGPSVRVTAFT